MGIRPLRQYYQRDGDAPPVVSIDPAFAIVLEPWRAHRTRFDAALRALPVDGWTRATRCSEWNVREVIGHLVVVDGFWGLTLSNARDGAAPTSFLDGFDPTNSTDDLVAATLPVPISELIEQSRAATLNVAGILDSFGPDSWTNCGESPLGHLPATVLAGHMLWDSWLHERDIFEPMGIAPESSADELTAVTWFALCFAALQGGLLDDPNAVGDAPESPIDCALTFDDLPGRALRVQIDEGLAISAADPADAVPAGSAVAFVDACAGRGPLAKALNGLPADLAAQLSRAALVLA